MPWKWPRNHAYTAVLSHRPVKPRTARLPIRCGHQLRPDQDRPDEPLGQNRVIHQLLRIEEELGNDASDGVHKMKVLKKQVIAT